MLRADSRCQCGGVDAGDPVLELDEGTVRFQDDGDDAFDGGHGGRPRSAGGGDFHRDQGFHGGDVIGQQRYGCSALRVCVGQSDHRPGGVLRPGIARRVTAGGATVHRGVQGHGVLEVVGKAGGTEQVDIDSGAKPICQVSRPDERTVLRRGYHDGRALSLRVDQHFGQFYDVAGGVDGSVQA